MINTDAIKNIDDLKEHKSYIVVCPSTGLVHIMMLSYDYDYDGDYDGADGCVCDDDCNGTCGRGWYMATAQRGHPYLYLSDSWEDSSFEKGELLTVLQSNDYSITS